MGAFEYLSVIISIVLSLSLAQLVEGLGRIIQLRRQITFYWPTLLAVLTLILVDIQFWWTTFNLRDRNNWSYFSFLAMVLLTVLLTLVATLTLPNFDDGETDLRATYRNNAPWYFSMLVAANLVYLAMNLLLEGRAPSEPELSTHFVLGALCLSGVFIRSDLWHKVLSVALTGSFLVYMALMAASSIG
jgi:hypothetical protein